MNTSISAGSGSTERTRVMHVITGLETGGAEMFLWRLLASTSAQWDHVVVSLRDEGTVGSRIAELGVPLYTLGLRHWPPNPFRLFTLRSLVRRFHPQLIQGWMYHGNLTASLAAGFDKGRPPVLWNIRQALYDTASERLITAAVMRLGARLSGRAASIIYNSRISAQQHEELGYSAARRVIIPNGFDSEKFRPDEQARRQVRAELGVGDDAILVGLVARYHPIKDHAGFLRAAAIVARKHPETRFVLIGPRVTEKEPFFLQMMAEPSHQGRLFLLGERTDIARLTAALDIDCSASWSESFSNTIGEAMACGVPCVVTDVGESAHLVADTGLCVPPRDHQALAHAIHCLIEGGETYRRQLGAAARQRVLNEFSFATVAGRYQDLYRAHIKLPSVPVRQKIPRRRALASSRPRILHVITSLGTGGTEMMLMKLISATNNGDWEQAVISLDNEPSIIAPRISQLGVPVHSLRVSRTAPNPVRALTIVPIARGFRPHLIQGWMYHGNVLASVAASLGHERVPVLWNIQQSLYDIGVERRLTANIIRLGIPLSRRLAAIIYNSAISARQHEQFGYQADKSVVIPTGFDCQTFHPDENARRKVRSELGLAEGAVLMGLVARYHPMKDHAGFLRAAGLVAREHPAAHFLCVGKGLTVDNPTIMALVREYGLQEHISLVGERPDLPRLTAALDIACSASAWGEGCSNTIGEAMACAVPCVVTDVGDSAFLIGNTG